MQKTAFLKTIQKKDQPAYDTLPQTTIHFGILLDPPYAYPCFNVHPCYKPGYGVEIIRAICGILSVPCKLTAVKHTMYGNNLAGEWQGMVRQIVDGEFDTSMPNFTPTPERLKIIQFSNPVAS